MKVLVVDDNQDAAVSLGMLVELLGHEVRTAFDGEEALAIADALHPDLVLLDLGMPGLDGYETCRRMRGRPWGARTRIVAVTGWGQDEHRRNATLAGFDQHLVKPVEMALIVSTLDSPVSAQADCAP